ncbi:hypothetical protein LguiB_001367 [Lonicera macranthoides]
MDLNGKSFLSQLPPATQMGIVQEPWPLGRLQSMGFSDRVFPQRTGMPNCAYYMRTGCCGYGRECVYNHPLDRNAEMESPEALSKPKKLRRTKDAIVDKATSTDNALMMNDEYLKDDQVICSLNQPPPNPNKFEGHVVLVENFPFTSFDETRENLKKQFEKCGEIEDLFIPKNENGPGMKGMAFITFGNEEDLKTALALDVGDEFGLRVSEPRYPEILYQCGYEGGYGGVYGYPIEASKKKKKNKSKSKSKNAKKAIYATDFLEEKFHET